MAGILRVAACVLLGLGAPPAVAMDDAAVIETMERTTEVAIGRDLTPDEAAAVAAETRAELAADPEGMAGILPVLAETAMAMRTTSNMAAQGVLYDTMRQLLTEAYRTRADPTALALLVRNDSLAAEHAPGIGLANSDIHASAWLRALHEGRFDDPEAVALSQDDINAHVRELLDKYPREVPENQQVMSRMNAWAAGVRAAWASMSAEERRAAVAVSTTPDIPSEAVVEKVTGTRDVIKWIAGMDLALEPELAERFPVAVTFHRDGGTAEAMAGLFGRLGAGSLASDWSEFQSLQMLQNLNNFYSNGGLTSGYDAGGIMLGLE